MLSYGAVPVARRYGSSQLLQSQPVNGVGWRRIRTVIASEIPSGRVVLECQTTPRRGNASRRSKPHRFYALRTGGAAVAGSAGSQAAEEVSLVAVRPLQSE